MVSLIDQLERAGLAKRRLHPQDRRAREVLITAKGRRTSKRARELAQAVEDDVLQACRPLSAPADHAPSTGVRGGAAAAAVDLCGG